MQAELWRDIFMLGADHSPRTMLPEGEEGGTSLPARAGALAAGQEAARSHRTDLILQYF